MKNQIDFTVEAVPETCRKSLANLALALACNKALDRATVAALVRQNYLAAYIGGHHVAVHAAGPGGDITGERLAIITGTGPDWD